MILATLETLLYTRRGEIALVVLAAAVFLFLVYRWLSRRGGVAPSAADRDEAYIHRAEEAVRAAGLTFSGMPIMGLFGTLNAVRRVGTDAYGLCQIPRSALVDDEVCARFERYAQLIHSNPVSGLAPLVWWNADEGLLALVQGGIMRDDGHPQMVLSKYLLDRRMSHAESEGLLLKLAETFKQLHSLQTDRGEQLYHGWLLPRSLFVTLDSSRKLSEVVLADGGLMFAFGPERVAAQIAALRASYIGLDAFRARRLQSELPNLAPEQQGGMPIVAAGPRSDIFAYGSLAFRLFAQRPLSGPLNLDWALVPAAWRPFLKGCLEPLPFNRPPGFEQFSLS